MAIIGIKKRGWNGTKNGAKYGLLIQFDDRVERDEFEGIVEKISEFMDLQAVRKE